MADEDRGTAARAQSRPSVPGTRRWNCSSPTASTSSTSRISGSIVDRDREAQRACMPDEYVLTGLSMNARARRTRRCSSKRRTSSAVRHPEDGPVEEDVLPPGELGVEAGAQLEQRRDALRRYARLPGPARGSATAPSAWCSCRRRWRRPARTSIRRAPRTTHRAVPRTRRTSPDRGAGWPASGSNCVGVDAKRLPQAVNDDVSGGHPQDSTGEVPGPTGHAKSCDLRHMSHRSRQRRRTMCARLPAAQRAEDRNGGSRPMAPGRRPASAPPRRSRPKASRTAGVSPAATGQPRTAASRTGRPHPSYRDGKSNAYRARR